MIKTLKISIICILILLSASTAFSQPDILNKFNDEGKKVGYWKKFYSSKLEEVKDTLKAKYYGYEYYINGCLFRCLYGMVEAGKVKIKYKAKDSLENNKKGMILLDGNIFTYDKFNNLAYKAEFLKGIIVRQNSYSYLGYKNDNSMYEEEKYDFTLTYNNNKNSYYYEKKRIKLLNDKWKIKRKYIIMLDNGKEKTIKL